MEKSHMAGQEQPMEGERTAQISDDLVARMERAERQMEARKEPQQRGDVPAGADFASILDAIPDDDLDSLSLAFAAPPPPDREEAVKRDRNLSDVIERIRDEGPAEVENADLAEDVLELSSTAEAESGEKETDEKPVVEPAPVVTKSPEPVPETLRVGGGSARRNGFQAVVNLVLLGAVAMLGFLQYQQMQVETRLQAQLEETRQMLGELERLQAGLGEQLAGLRESEQPEAGGISREELEQALEAQRRRTDERFELVNAMLLPVLAAPAETHAALPGPRGKGERKAAGKSVAQAGEGQRKAARQSPGQAAPRKGWMVVLLSSSSRAQAEKARRQLGKRVDNLEIRTARVKGRTVYRLAVSGFPSRKAALEYRSRMSGQAGFEGAWVGRG
ncbi:MAG TPA: hypothetical protein ENJ98_07455 [Thiolapillus brandeum]|uniref:SPOR domain-containing protein n=1 Tax=Thiolapillus brandeum TaxID=1076588 RepID=A0A7C5MW58_9GAMM|nr:hypothetical protein [Thiolapillus brandeum]